MATVDYTNFAKNFELNKQTRSGLKALQLMSDHCNTELVQDPNNKKCAL